MESKLSVRGGAKIGWARASWPFAKLVVDGEKVELTSLLGSYRFRSADIVSVERSSPIPGLSIGVRIVHDNPEYPENVVFYSLSGTARIIDAIERMRRAAPPRTASAVRKARGIPVKIIPIVVVVLIWNALFLFEIFSRRRLDPRELLQSPGVIAAFAMVFGICVLVRASPAVAKLFLKPGRKLGEILPILNVLTLVSGGMLFFAVMSAR